MYDYHVHSTYSDGHFMEWMVRAAEEAGLAGVGIADHLIVSEQPAQRRRRRREGHALDRTYDRRRTAISEVREEVSIEVFDAVEVDYHPDDEPAIESFLAEAEFDYAVGSVHMVGGENVHVADPADPRAFVDRYVELVEAMLDSEQFAVAAHVDLPERNPALRGALDREHYERLARAFADSRTVPEVNAGRANRDFDHPGASPGTGFFHPLPEFLTVLRDHDVEFVAGTDAHAPEDLRERAGLLSERFDELGVEPGRIH